MILGIKFGRRMWAAVGLRDEEFVAGESRYTRGGKTEPTISVHQLQRLLEQLKPSVVCVYAPGGESNGAAVSAELVRHLESEAAKLGIAMKFLTRADIFESFGLVVLKTREELFQVMRAIWPSVGEAKAERQRVLAEAAAAALVGDLRQHWPPL